MDQIMDPLELAKAALAAKAASAGLSRPLSTPFQVRTPLGAEVELPIEEQPFAGLGGKVWPSARVMAAQLYDLGSGQERQETSGRIKVKRKRILDLGCGCGAVGIAAWAAGASTVVLSDLPTLKGLVRPLDSLMP